MQKNAGRDAWYHDRSVSVSIPSDWGREKLIEALRSSRNSLEGLKKEYCRAKRSATRKREVAVLLQEVVQVVNTIEEIKNRLVLSGVEIPLSERDVEHPDAACSRVSRCYVVTAIFGVNSQQLALVTRRCRRTFVQNPLLLPGWFLYKLYGPALAEWALHDSKAELTCRKLLAVPIVAATGKGLGAFRAKVHLVVLSLAAAILSPIFILGLGVLRLSRSAEPTAPPNRLRAPRSGNR